MTSISRFLWPSTKVSVPVSLRADQTGLGGIWKVFFEMIKMDRLRSLLEQHVNQTLFESLLKSHTPVSQSSAVCPVSQLPTLSADEKNIISWLRTSVAVE